MTALGQVGIAQVRKKYGLCIIHLLVVHYHPCVMTVRIGSMVTIIPLSVALNHWVGSSILGSLPAIKEAESPIIVAFRRFFFEHLILTFVKLHSNLQT